MSNLDTLRIILSNDLVAKWINLRDYALDKLSDNSSIKEIMDTADKYGYGEWALKPQVPKMTSNTSPYGEAISSGAYSSSYPNYYAFDGSDSTRFESADGNTGAWLGYHFPSGIKLGRVSLKARAISAANATVYKIQGSNDGSTWTDIDTMTVELPASTGTIVSVDKNVVSDTTYAYIRIYKESQTGDSQTMAIVALQFYAWQPKGNVPVMTSNTAPYGEVLYTTDSSYDALYPAWKVFDGTNDSLTDCRYTITVRTLGYADFGYKFVNPVKCNRVTVQNRIDDGSGNTYAIKDFKVQGSNDGSTWTDIATFQNTNQDSAGISEYVFDNDNYYLYMRIHVTSAWYYRTSSDRDDVAIANLQFYGRELSVSVPTMTSNTAPWGEAIKSSELGNYKAWNMFDGVEHAESINTYLAWHTGSRTDEWCGFDFKKPVVVKMMAILPSYQYGVSGDVKRVKSYKYQASNDGNVWEDLTDTLVTNQSTQNEWYYTLLNNDDAYRYYRVFVFDNWGSNYFIAISEAKIFTLDYSEREFAEGSTMKYIYDHGVELESITEQAGGGTIEKRGSEIYMAGTSSSTIGCTVTSGNIDFTDYKLAFARCGKEYIYNQYEGLVVSASYGSTAIAIQRPLVLPLSYLDISAVNQTAIVYVGTSSPGGKYTLAEFWLE